MRLTGIRAMELCDAPDPKIENDTDVLIKLGAVGVCGSDIHYYVSGRIGGQVVEYPFTVGHESAGAILEVGDRVTRFKPGDRIAIDPAMPCGDCDQCRAGRENTCRKMKFLGCPAQAEGALSERIVMPESNCFPLRDETTLEQGALSEPLAIGVYACKLAGPLEGARIGILGAGPIGLSVLLSARNWGAEKIYVTDKIDARLSLAKRAGADWTGNIEGQDIVETIAQAEPLLLDYVFECCGEQEAVDQAIALLKPGGKLMMIGIPSAERISLPMDPMRSKEICFQYVRRQNECTGLTIDMIQDKTLVPDLMVTHHFRFEQTKEAFDLVTEYADGVMKAMITFDD